MKGLVPPDYNQPQLPLCAFVVHVLRLYLSVGTTRRKLNSVHMDPDLLHLVILLSTTLALHQPRTIEAGAYNGPHPELLQHGELLPTDYS